MMKKLIWKIAEHFNLRITNIFPRYATREALKHFKDKEIIFCEVGTFKGQHAEDNLKRLNIKNAYLIDINPLCSFEDYKYVTLIKAKSNEAIDLIPMCDFIYIDADHSYKTIKEDLNNYWEKVKVGGIFAGHDIDLKDVGKALTEFIKEKDINNLICKNQEWIIYKENGRA